MTKPKRIGRPPQDPRYTRSEHLRLTVTPDEAAAIRRAAGRQPLSSWLRDIVKAALAKEKDA